jgi:integrase
LRWLRVRLSRRTDIIASPPSRRAARHRALTPGCYLVYLVYLAVIEENIALVGHRKVGQLTIGELDTFATQLAEAGLHPSKCQGSLGHTHATTTMTYYTLITDVDEAADLRPDLR